MLVILAAMISVAVLVGVGFASWWAGVGIFVAMIVVLVWRVPSGPME